MYCFYYTKTFKVFLIISNALYYHDYNEHEYKK